MQKETRRLNIDRRVVSKNDVRRIAHIFDEEFQLAQKARHHSSLTFKLYCENRVAYESDSPDLFNDDGPLDIKRTFSIQMALFDYEKGRYIDFDLRDGNRNGDLSVSGNDKEWVQGTFTTIQEIIESITPQDNLILRHRTIALHLIALGLGYLIYFILNLLLYRHIKPFSVSSDLLESISHFFITYPLAYYFFFYGFGRWSSGIWFAPQITNWLVELWPNIEFDFGPNHLKKSKIRRQRIGIVLTLIILPIILEFMSRLF